MHDGVRVLPGYLDRGTQLSLLAAIRRVIEKAPFFVPRMPKSGRPFSVRMTNCGALGWVSDSAGGYRYQEVHPETGERWPSMPKQLVELWREVSACPAPPQACLVNWYDPQAKMGLHVDRDERDFTAPVVSISLGDDAWFRVGGLKRGDPTERLLLKSGDVIVLGGPARLVYHGVDRILPGTSDLLEKPGRINLTLRRVAG